MRVSTANRVITGIRDRVGRGAASHAKVALSGIFALTVRHDVVDKNPVREIESLGKKKRKKECRVNSRNVGQVLGVFHASADAERWDLVDMMDVLSGLGCRVGELLALDWDTSIDFDEGTVRFAGTVIRITGQAFPAATGTLRDPDNTRSRNPPGRQGDGVRGAASARLPPLRCGGP